MGSDGLIRLAAAIVLAGCGAGAQPPVEPESGTVVAVNDGDTLRLVDGRRVRLVQIDAPERHEECFGEQARSALVLLASPGTTVRLEREPSLDDRDRFGRVLRTIFTPSRNVNLALVRRGAAAPYFYRGDHGRGAGALLAAAKRARAERRGLWGSCPRARLRPNRSIDSGPP